MLRKAKDVDWNPVTKQGRRYDYYSYGAVCTEVEIDVLTGENHVTFSILLFIYFHKYRGYSFHDDVTSCSNIIFKKY